MRRTFRYRMRPTQQEARALVQMLETHRRLYNRALAERRDAWTQDQRRVRYEDQSAQLKVERTRNPYLAQTNFSSCQATLRRLKKTFEAFFARVKRGDQAGYPKFKGWDRFNTVEYPSYGDGCKLDRDRVYFQHIGTVRFVQHRPFAGTIKTVSFTRQGDAWYLLVSCDLGTPDVKPHSGPAVGIDVGLAKFATFSTGEQIANPRFFRKDERELARAQRRLSKEAKGTPERKRRRKVVRKIYARIANRRKDFAHKLSRRLVDEFGLIVFEDLEIARMMQHPRLAKSIADAAWNRLITSTTYKAEETGAVCIEVDPRGTSQRCSRCGTVVKKALSERMHRCPACGLEIDRDLNAALNLLGMGLHSLGAEPEKPPR